MAEKLNENEIIGTYITETAFNALGALENHEEDVVSGPKTKKEKKNDIKTTHYGITNNGLDSFKRLSKKFDIEIPKELDVSDVNKLSGDKAKRIALRLTALNTMQIDRNFLDVTGYDTQYFSRLDLETRSALLTYFHTGQVESMKNTYGEKGSVMSAIETGNKEAIGIALMSRPDGTLMLDPNKIDGKDGQRNRIYATIKMMYDPYNQDFSKRDYWDSKFVKWRNQQTTTNLSQCLTSIQNANKLSNEEIYKSCELKYVAIPNIEEAENPGNMKLSKDVYTGLSTEEEDKNGFLKPLINLYNGLKNIFNNGKEKEENYNFVPLDEQVDDRGEKFVEVDKNVTRK